MPALLQGTAEKGRSLSLGCLATALATAQTALMYKAEEVSHMGPRRKVTYLLGYGPREGLRGGRWGIAGRRSSKKGERGDESKA